MKTGTMIARVVVDDVYDLQPVSDSFISVANSKLCCQE